LEAYPSFESLKGVIIDAGAHARSFAIPASFFADKVVAIEPNPIMVKILEMNTLINRRRNIDILPYALYHSSKTVYFNPDDITSVMGTVSKEGKIIEGAEYDVLFNARKESLRRIKRLVGERNVGKVWGIPKFYSPFRVLKAVKNSARIKGQIPINTHTQTHNVNVFRQRDDSISLIILAL
jgi:methyltransferase, FkbM family